MSEHAASCTDQDKPKRRKLKYPRASNACNFCKKRKVRCSGNQPCNVCVREEVTCEYATGAPLLATSPPIFSAHGSTLTSPAPLSQQSHVLKRDLAENRDPSRHETAPNDIGPSRRGSMDPPQTFIHGTHVGPTSGVSFLYGQWSRGQPQDRLAGVQSEEEVVLPYAPLISYGDIPQLDVEARPMLTEPDFTVEQILNLLERYFSYISPTYRFLHHPTVRQWATAYVAHERQLTVAQRACVLLVCAQTLLHSPVSPSVAQVGKGDVRMSMACAEKAKALLDKEPGPPSLASVQARIGMCLYFLSAFRLNECRYCFSFAVSVATALGIHRRQPMSSKLNVLDSECRRRAFWSVYVLDGYLSVMLGRPRLLRDEDIDQPFPQNIADDDLASAESIDTLPRHGNLEAFIAHANLAKLMARGNDQLYPLHSLTNDQILQRSNEMLDALTAWHDSLPGFLRPRDHTMTGQRTFERQNTILKLAYAHVRILVTRRCLLMNLGHEATPLSQFHSARAKRSVQECISAIIMILDTTETLIEHGQCYGSFWTTQYIALVAISTLYVLLIQGVRHALPGDVESFLNVEESFEKARRCHDHLAMLPPSGSQAERHHVLLSHLRCKAERSLAKRKNPGSSASVSLPQNSKPTSRTSSQYAESHGSLISANTSDQYSSPNQTVQNISYGVMAEPFTPPLNRYVAMNGGESSNDMSLFSSMLTPNSSSDTNFQYMLDFGWESLDTIGANMRGQDKYLYDMA